MTVVYFAVFPEPEDVDFACALATKEAVNGRINIIREYSQTTYPSRAIERASPGNRAG
jgi:hypothetical protein